MQIKDLHSDIARYLENDCYCPNEIYSSDGFFYQIFKADEECKKKKNRRLGEIRSCRSKRPDARLLERGRKNSRRHPIRCHQQQHGHHRRSRHDREALQ